MKKEPKLIKWLPYTVKEVKKNYKIVTGASYDEIEKDDFLVWTYKNESSDVVLEVVKQWKHKNDPQLNMYELKVKA